MTRRRKGPDTWRGHTHGFKVMAVSQTLGGKKKKKNHTNHQLQNQNTLELCKDKHISNSDQEKPTSTIQPSSNSLVKPAQSLVLFSVQNQFLPQPAQTTHANQTEVHYNKASPGVCTPSASQRPTQKQLCMVQAKETQLRALRYSMA